MRTTSTRCRPTQSPCATGGLQAPLHVVPTLSGLHRSLEWQAGAVAKISLSRTSWSIFA